jgi:hypothetical protein
MISFGAFPSFEGAETSATITLRVLRNNRRIKVELECDHEANNKSRDDLLFSLDFPFLLLCRSYYFTRCRYFDICNGLEYDEALLERGKSWHESSLTRTERSEPLQPTLRLPICRNRARVTQSKGKKRLKMGSIGIRPDPADPLQKLQVSFLLRQIQD